MDELRKAKPMIHLNFLVNPQLPVRGQHLSLVWRSGRYLKRMFFLFKIQPCFLSLLQTNKQELIDPHHHVNKKTRVPVVAEKSTHASRLSQQILEEDLQERTLSMLDQGARAVVIQQKQKRGYLEPKGFTGASLGAFLPSDEREQTTETPRNKAARTRTQGAVVTVWITSPAQLSSQAEILAKVMETQSR